MDVGNQTIRNKILTNESSCLLCSGGKRGEECIDDAFRIALQAESLPHFSNLMTHEITKIEPLLW